ncbi:MAG: threonylcarbamoyl-AMP synthase [Bacteroidales bacterium]|nr:threonylcarbamoyl-AMP synthase [Bacteroidales bacterium]
MKEDIKKAVEVLKSGGIILYPTDTIWGLGCDATSARAVQKIYKIKQRSGNTPLLVLLEDEKKIGKYVMKVPDIIGDLLKSIDSPTTIIYPNAKNLAKNVLADDGSIGIRIVRDEFCQKLLKEFDKPLVSTSANLTGEKAPVTFRDISNAIKEKVDYIVESNRQEVHKTKASTIIKMKDNGEFEIIRQ